jgi:hypothetical protein
MMERQRTLRARRANPEGFFPSVLRRRASHQITPIVTPRRGDHVDLLAGDGTGPSPGTEQSRLHLISAGRQSPELERRRPRRFITLEGNFAAAIEIGRFRDNRDREVLGIGFDSGSDRQVRRRKRDGGGDIEVQSVGGIAGGSKGSKDDDQNAKEYEPNIHAVSPRQRNG